MFTVGTLKNSKTIPVLADTFRARVVLAHPTSRTTEACSRAKIFMILIEASLVVNSIIFFESHVIHKSRRC